MDATEKKILEAAYEVLMKKGRDKATTLEIAKAAGVSEMTVFRKFKSKENLIRAVSTFKNPSESTIREAYESPSLYDYFYFDFVMLKKALSFRGEILEGKDGSLLPGYVYFIEFCVAKLIENVEEAPYNEHIFEIVNWGRFDISDKEIQHLKKTSTAFKTVFDLNECRATLSGLRRRLITTQKLEDKERLSKTLDTLEKMNTEINSEIVKLYSARRREEVDQEAENLMVFHWFMVSYVYEPPRLFFSTMSNQTARSYMPEPQYLTGFKFCIEKIMNWLTGDKYSGQIKEGLTELETLMDLHDFYSRMHGSVFKDTKWARIFDVVEPKWEGKALLKGVKVMYPYQLNLIFRGREIKVVEVEEFGGIRSDRDAVQRLFIDAIFGGIMLGVPKVEIVLFEEYVKDGKDWDKYYSYALYLPMHGMIGDASTWLIFPRLDGTSNWESYDDIKKYLENKMKDWGRRITLRKYKIKADLLKNYINNKEWGSMKKKNMEVRQNTSRGLLAEFLAYFYIWSLHKAQLVEFHKEEEDTDVDVVAEDANSRYIVQVKNSITSDRKKLEKELEGIAKQLEKMEKKYSIRGKMTKKTLFVVDWAWDEKKFLEIEDWDTYLQNNYLIALRILKKHNIDLIIYSKMKSVIKFRYKDFEKKIKEALDLFEPEDLI
ncbi:MAG TPA: TetR/AcrR family transcriptional regulator [Candidatus Acidoferrum sp.]|nr:TetR/AcrR family transcriptional regulator [Candidatus Acidoferrum sp.]